MGVATTEATGRRVRLASSVDVVLPSSRKPPARRLLNCYMLPKERH